MQTQRFASLIHTASKILLCTHAVPDGDGIGSEIALYHGLKKLGKTVNIINPDPIPEKFHFIDQDRAVGSYAGTDISKKDLVIVLDTHDWKMLGGMEAPLRKVSVPVLFIDHHEPDEKKGKEYFIDTSCIATGEVVYQLLKVLSAPLDLPVATALYVSLVSDARTFIFRGTTASFHRTLADLLEAGVSSLDVYQKLFAKESFAKVRLFGHVLENLKSSADGKLAWLIVTKKMRKHYGATVEETESFINELTAMDKVQIGILFREEDNGQVKVSLRGNSGIAVIDVAKDFGGGGHRYAAGMRLGLPMEEALSQVLKRAEKSLASKANAPNF